jgi:monooxygenase
MDVSFFKNVAMQNHYDFIIIGAGLSGVGIACSLRLNAPGKSFVIFEGAEEIGGTWDLFKYPGVRSDSDMYTLGYSFKPWVADYTLADGGSIKKYIQEAINENNLSKHIRLKHKVYKANWNSRQEVWEVTIKNSNGEDEVFTCQFLWACTGYYKREEGFLPEFAGYSNFKGKIIHPQFWPKDYDYSNEEVILIGSGATAVTVVPEMAKKTKHITMLQRSPTYMYSLPEKDPISMVTRKWFNDKIAFYITRWYKILWFVSTYVIVRSFPKIGKRFFLSKLKKQLGEDMVKEHFTPRYNVWDQRVAAVPDNDLFNVIKNKKASVVTDHIDRFTEHGILLKSGRELKADTIITATGLVMVPLGGLALHYDNKKVELGERLSYKQMFIEGLPNFIYATGYPNASWTLKLNLITTYFLRMLRYMQNKGLYSFVIKRDKPNYNLSANAMNSGYILRGEHLQPKQPTESPWAIKNNFILDSIGFKYGSIKNKALHYNKKSS